MRWEKVQLPIATLLLFNFATVTSAIAQGGWLFMVAPVDEVQMKALPQDRKFQAMSFEEKRSAVRKLVINAKAGLAEWVQDSAFDSAAQCEEFKGQLLTLQLEGEINVQRYHRSDEYKKYKKEGQELRKESQKVLEETRNEEARSALSGLLDAQDRFEKESEAGNDLNQLVKNEQTREGRCLPASAVFPQKR